VVADVDAVAEAQGIGAALRKREILPMAGAMQLMAYPSLEPPQTPDRGVRVERIAKEGALYEKWVEIVAGEPDAEWHSMWEQVARAEAKFAHSRLYLGFVDERPAAVCSLISMEGAGRIESVMTLEAFRRRGAASALTAQAVADSLADGNDFTYLFTEWDGDGAKVYRKLGFETLARAPFRRHKEQAG
jgi:predicted GNAT family acetyltransferase